MGSEYDCIASRELRQLLLTFYTLLFQFFYNTGIMNQFTQSGNTIIIPFCLQFCNVYRSFYSITKAARVCNIDFHLLFFPVSVHERLDFLHQLFAQLLHFQFISLFVL